MSTQWVRIATYLNGGGSAAERVAMAQWIDADPRRGAAVKEMARAWEQVRTNDGVATPAVDMKAAWQEVTRRSGLTMPREISRTGQHIRGHVGGMAVRPRAISATWIGMFAAAVLIGAVGLVWSGRDRVLAGNSAPTVYRTAVGQRATVTLSDGSRVTIAPQTTLTVDAHFGQSERNVTLVGEAVFDVVAEHRVPFVVHTQHVSTRVLGTVFDIRRYPDDRDTRVAVVSGRVAIGRAPGSNTPDGNVIVLNAGMIGRFNDSTTITVVSGETRSYADWTKGRLVFDDVPVPSMLETLHRWSGYEFRLTDSTLAARHVTTAFVIGEHQAMLQQLKRLLDVNMTFDDSVVTLRPRGGAKDSMQGRERRTREQIPLFKEIGR